MYQYFCEEIGHTAQETVPETSQEVVDLSQPPRKRPRNELETNDSIPILGGLGLGSRMDSESSEGHINREAAKANETAVTERDSQGQSNSELSESEDGSDGSDDEKSDEKETPEMRV